jgi:hypothetical protein
MKRLTFLVGGMAAAVFLLWLFLAAGTAESRTSPPRPPAARSMSSGDTADRAITKVGPATVNVTAGTEFFITLSPVCAGPGATVTVNGYNWPIDPPDEDVVITWDPNDTPDPSQLLATIPSVNSPTWSTTFVVPNTASFAYHTIEATRQNDTATAQFKVPCPTSDLVITAPTLVSTLPITAAAPVSFRFTITNQGDAPANSTLFVGLYFDPIPPPVLGSDTGISSTFLVQMLGINGLAVGSSQVLTITAPNGFSTIGPHTVYGVVDILNSVTESDETNNISQPLIVNVGRPLYLPIVLTANSTTLDQR